MLIAFHAAADGVSFAACFSWQIVLAAVIGGAVGYVLAVVDRWSKPKGVKSDGR